MDPDKLGGRVRAARKIEGMTIAEVAHEAGVSDRTVSALERGERVPRVAHLTAILDAVGIESGVWGDLLRGVQ